MVVATKLRNREELPQLLSQVIESIKHDKTKIDVIKENLRKEYSILPGKIQKIINNSEEELQEVDDELLYLLTNQFYFATGDMSIAPDQFFNEREIKEIKTNYEADIRETLTFPQTLYNVEKGTDDNYIAYDKDGILIEWYENKLLQWNPDSQREARQYKDSIVPVAKVIEKSVKEIEELAIRNKLIISMVTLNARVGSSDIGEELIYDEEKRTLTITEGTLMDTLDGFHRLTGLSRAKRKNPSLKQIIIINILNYDKARAREQFVQINTTNQVSISHMKKMKESRQADFIANYVQGNSELNGRIANSDRISPNSDLLVTFGTLSDAIDEVYDIKDKRTAIETAKYLSEFINKLFLTYSNEFMGNVADIRKSSLINANVMFYGYILLSKRMKDENIELSEIPNIIESIDFSRTNKTWRKLNILDSSERILNRAKKSIYDFFTKIKIK